MHRLREKYIFPFGEDKIKEKCCIFLQMSKSERTENQIINCVRFK